jgi:RimJ/RimL family protein N-acetyltransferase
LAELHSLWTDDRVRQFLWDGELIPIERTQEIIKTSSILFNERGFGLWAVRKHGCDELLGFTGYWFFRTPPELELLFGIASDCWGQDFATEAARSVVEYGLEVLGFEVISASTDAPNLASRRVLDKLGMRRRAVMDKPDTYFFSLTRSDWENASYQPLEPDDSALPLGR